MAAAVSVGDSVKRLEASRWVMVLAADGVAALIRLLKLSLRPRVARRERSTPSMVRSSTPLTAFQAPVKSSRTERWRRRTNQSVESLARRCHSASDGLPGFKVPRLGRGTRSFCKSSNGFCCASRLGAAGLTTRVTLSSRAITARHSWRGTGASTSTAVESRLSALTDRSIGCKASASSTSAGSSSSGTMLKSTSTSAGKKFCVKSSGLITPGGNGPTLGSAGKWALAGKGRPLLWSSTYRRCAWYCIRCARRSARGAKPRPGRSPRSAPSSRRTMASSIQTMVLFCRATMASGSTLADSPDATLATNTSRATRPRLASSASAAPSSCQGTSTTAVASITSPSSTVRCPVIDVG